MDQIWTRINELAEANNGFVRTAQVEALGISRPMLRKYTDAGKLEQVRKGLYVLADGMPDEYALLQGQCRDAVFSYGTALYLWGLSDRTPHIYDITIPRDKNISVLKRDNPNLRCHYLPRDVYEIGITQTRSPQGAEIKLYDKELDYIWLLKMVKIFKYGVYKMLYTKILTCEIDEAQLKNVLKCWV